MTYRHQRRVGLRWVIFLLLAAIVFPIGCTRRLYRRQADREANYLVREKSVHTPWEIPASYTIQPDPRSRFFDPTDPDFPTLPPAGPKLYHYQLPELSSQRKSWQPEPLPETAPKPIPGEPATEPELPAPPPVPQDVTSLRGVAAPMLRRLPSVPGDTTGVIASSNRLPPYVPQTNLFGSTLFASNQYLSSMLPPKGHGVNVSAAGVLPSSGASRLPMPQAVQLAAYQQGSAAPDEAQATTADPFMEFIDSLGRSRNKTKGLKVQPIGEKYWDDIPANCLALMLDFESVRLEYMDTHKHAPEDALRDNSPRMTLHDLFELALLNSRDYQRQKEILYQAALDVALQRFAYSTKLSVRGATVDTTYTHARVRGTTVNSLAVPSVFSGDKALATGGTLVGRFANDVLLTFNGPSGFAADVSSELLFDITQRVFQRDILLEPLIQSERNLVYQARSFARFRKQFFLDVADTYYGILLGYRRIEIAAQNYFARVRAFQQMLEEVESGVSSAPSAIFLNQIERSALQALSSLIGQSNVLLQQIDSMKITLGIPTETKINVNLDELVQLTIRDTIEVNRAQSERWLNRLEKLRAKTKLEHGDILTADDFLSERLIKWLWERSKVAGDTASARELFKELAVFRLDAARLDMLAEWDTLEKSKTANPPKQRIIILQHQVEVIESVLLLVSRQLDYAAALGHTDARFGVDQAKWHTMQRRFEYLLEAMDEFLKMNPDKKGIIDKINLAKSPNPPPRKPEEKPTSVDEETPIKKETPEKVALTDDQIIIALLDGATVVLADSETLSQDMDDHLFGARIKTVDLNSTLERTDRLIEFAQRVFAEAEGGLPPIDISVDEAMITALVQRLDLMNERGGLADDWRTIKFAADALKSNMSLGASQRIGTDTNRPFSFSTDNANTRLRLTWDLPVNRKRERNAYRRSLINYNVGLRSLMLFEDNIKFNVRRELRDLDQLRVRYPIFVDVAALAQEQVIGTQMQLTLGITGVRAVDLLDAFNSARTALGDMVDARIGYIRLRARFAFDLEAIMLDDVGYWPEINDPKYQPEPNGAYPWNAGAAYGSFPSYLKTSHELRRMLNYPPPGAHSGALQRGEQPELEATPAAGNGAAGNGAAGNGQNPIDNGP